MKKLIFLVFLLIASPVWAYSPIAHNDVVPYQRVKYGEEFTFGVVAFSKPGILHVDFDIVPASGTYTCSADTGETCVDSDTVRTTTMRENTRVSSSSTGVNISSTYDGVWEYYITLKSSEFSANTTFTVTATVTDNNSNTKVLEAITLIAEGSSAYSHNECWVDPVGSDGTGTANDEEDPFPTISSAVSACQTANSGDSSGNIIYLAEYDGYDLGVSFSTSGEWLTVTKEDGAATANVIITDGVPSSKIKLDGVTLEAQGGSQEILSNNDKHFWTNDCRIIGAGRAITRSSPIFMNLQSISVTGKYYSTGDYVYDVNYAYHTTTMIRGVTIEKVQDDVFENFLFVVNARIDDVTNGASSAHSDVLQTYMVTDATIDHDNRLAFNVVATDLHYQGWMRSATHATKTPDNNAMVNVFLEMRESADWGGSSYQLRPANNITHADDDHFLVWHCSFPYGHTTAGGAGTNSSVVGNLFWTFDIDFTPDSTTDYLYNHFMYANGETVDCTPTSASIYGEDCPRVNEVSVDTGSSTYSTGPGVVDVSNPGASDFGYPVAGSALIDALPSVYVPCDAYGNPRDSSPDIGAIEYGASVVVRLGFQEDSTGTTGCSTAGAGTTVISTE